MKKRDLDLELCLAVIEPAPEKVDKLIVEGANVNAIGDKGYTRIAHCTPLWLAIQNAGQEMSESWTELYGAVKEVFPKIPERNHATKRQEFKKIAKSLIEAGANLEAHCFGSTPLWQAVRAKDSEMVKLLLSSGANPNAYTLSIVSNFAKKERVKGPLGIMGYCDTVLHKAVEKRSSTIAEDLLTAGANPMTTDHEGKTPLNIAQEKSFDDMVQILNKVQLKK